ncbi:hypothetical protein Y032_0017g3477 [Ancylostoma ceylanicum]|nr:hypothetical protein Y032_0017g3477 [Ancylostoma ceylanicum]
MEDTGRKRISFLFFSVYHLPLKMSRGGRAENGGVRRRREVRSRSRSPQKGDPKRFAGGRDGDRRSVANDRMVFITNLAYEVRWAELKDVLREHGGEVRLIFLLFGADRRISKDRLVD